MKKKQIGILKILSTQGFLLSLGEMRFSDYLRGILGETIKDLPDAIGCLVVEYYQFCDVCKSKVPSKMVGEGGHFAKKCPFVKKCEYCNKYQMVSREFFEEQNKTFEEFVERNSWLVHNRDCPRREKCEDCAKPLCEFFAGEAPERGCCNGAC